MTFELAHEEVQTSTTTAPVAFPRQSRRPVARPSARRTPTKRRVGKRPARRFHNHVGFSAFVLGMLALTVGLLPYAGVIPYAALGPFAFYVPYVGYLAPIPGIAGLLFTIAGIDNLRRRVANNYTATVLGGLASIAGILLPWLFLALAVANPAQAEKGDTGLPAFTACLARAMTTDEVNACS